MIKRINIFDYQDYVLFLNNDFIERSTKNPSYSLRAYARDLSLSVGYLSKILKRKQHLALSRGEKILNTLGYTGSELEYGKHLLIYNTSKSDYEKEQSFAYICKYHPFSILKPDASKDLVLHSINHFLVFSLIKMFSTSRELVKVSKKIGIDKELFNSIINELLENKYIEKDKNKYYVTDNSFIIKQHEKLHLFHNDFSKFVLGKLVEMGDLSRNDCSGHGLTLSVDSELLPEILDAIEHTVRTLYKIAEKSTKKKTDYIVYFSESTIAIDNRK